MRKVTRVLLAAVFVSLLFGATGTQTDPFPIFNVDTVKLAWDVHAQDATIANIEVQVMDEAGVVVMTFSVPKASWEVVGTANKVAVRTQVQDLANGLYQFRARVLDDALNYSPWSTVMWARKNWIVYQPPGGCRFLPW